MNRFNIEVEELSILAAADEVDITGIVFGLTDEIVFANNAAAACVTDALSGVIDEDTIDEILDDCVVALSVTITEYIDLLLKNYQKLLPDDD